MKSARREIVAAVVAVALVAAAFAVPHLNLGIVTPLINSTPRQIEMFAQAAPIFGWWDAHVGWGTIPAIAIGLGTTLWGPAVAQVAAETGQPRRRIYARALELTRDKP